MKNHMKKWITLIMMVMIGISGSLFMSACERDSGLEDAVEAVEDAAEDAAEGIEDAAEEVDDLL